MAHHQGTKVDNTQLPTDLHQTSRTRTNNRDTSLTNKSVDGVETKVATSNRDTVLTHPNNNSTVTHNKVVTTKRNSQCMCNSSLLAEVLNRV